MTASLPLCQSWMDWNARAEICCSSVRTVPAKGPLRFMVVVPRPFQSWVPAWQHDKCDRENTGGGSLQPTESYAASQTACAYGNAYETSLVAHLLVSTRRALPPQSLRCPWTCRHLVAMGEGLASPGWPCSLVSAGLHAQILRRMTHTSDDTHAHTHRLAQTCHHSAKLEHSPPKCAETELSHTRPGVASILKFPLANLAKTSGAGAGGIGRLAGTPGSGVVAAGRADPRGQSINSAKRRCASGLSPTASGHVR